MIVLRQLQRLWMYKSKCQKKRSTKTTCTLAKTIVLKTKRQVRYRLFKMVRMRSTTTSRIIREMILSTKSMTTTTKTRRKKTNLFFWSRNILSSNTLSMDTKTRRLSSRSSIWRISRRKQLMLTSAKAINKTLWSIIRGLVATQQIKGREASNEFRAKLLRPICPTWTRGTFKTLTIWNWSTTV